MGSGPGPPYPRDPKRMQYLARVRNHLAFLEAPPPMERAADAGLPSRPARSRAIYHVTRVTMYQTTRRSHNRLWALSTMANGIAAATRTEHPDHLGVGRFQKAARNLHRAANSEGETALEPETNGVAQGVLTANDQPAT